MTAVLGLAGLMAIPASAQYYPSNNRGNWGWQDRDHDHDGRYNNGNYQNSAAYQQGYKDGVWDTQHGPQQRSRNWKNDYDAQAYRQGYNAGYRGTGAYNNNGRYNGRYDNRGSYGYGNSGYSGYGNRAYSQQGLIDGQNDGSRDRQTGHSFRPTEQPGWKHADRGYPGGNISKEQYKQIYRDAYMQGYQRGYYGR